MLWSKEAFLMNVKRTFNDILLLFCSCTYKKHLKNEGLPHMKNATFRGDLIIHFDIKFPTYIPMHLRGKFDELFEETDECEQNEKKLCVYDCEN
jgi:DnaJ-class molecular chaperone